MNLDISDVGSSDSMFVQADCSTKQKYWRMLGISKKWPSILRFKIKIIPSFEIMIRSLVNKEKNIFSVIRFFCTKARKNRPKLKSKTIHLHFQTTIYDYNSMRHIVVNENIFNAWIFTAIYVLNLTSDVDANSEYGENHFWYHSKDCK